LVHGVGQEREVAAELLARRNRGMCVLLPVCPRCGCMPTEVRAGGRCPACGATLAAGALAGMPPDPNDAPPPQPGRRDRLGVMIGALVGVGLGLVGGLAAGAQSPPDSARYALAAGLVGGMVFGGFAGGVVARLTARLGPPV
jgi:hypothetical protein